jgi:uncharacterized membrane protein
MSDLIVIGYPDETTAYNVWLVLPPGPRGASPLR